MAKISQQHVRTALKKSHLTSQNEGLVTLDQTPRKSALNRSRISRNYHSEQNRLVDFNEKIKSLVCPQKNIRLKILTYTEILHERFQNNELKIIRKD